MYMLVFFCAVLRMLAAVQAEAQYFIVAPNVIRVDVDETILVNILDTADAGDRIPVTLYFQFSGSNQRISQREVTVTKDSPQQAILQVSRDELVAPEAGDQQYVTLVASANTPQLTFEDRRTILLSYKAGFVFIQTDKPLYTPSQRVDIRVVALNQEMQPDSHELQVDIVNPDQIIVHRYNRAAKKGFLTLQFDFPPVPVFGNWTVVAYYGHKLKINTSVQFEVKEYVLPTFHVEVVPQEKYIIPGTVNLITHVNAKYVFGKPVVGSFLVKYGVFTDEGNLTILQRKQSQLNDAGRGIVDLVMADVTLHNWAETLMGKRLVIQAFVTNQATGETINANNTQVTFSRTPYKFNWDLTRRYFKKGLPFAVKANVLYLSGIPAANVHIDVTATATLQNGNEVLLQGSRTANRNQEPVRKVSGSQGEVDFRLDVPADAAGITISLATDDDNLDESTQSRDTFAVQLQESEDDEYLSLRRSSRGRQTQIGRRSSFEVQFTHPENVGTLHYFVIAGGRIVYKNDESQINPTIGLTILITQDMVPSSRVVAYYASTNGKIIADALLMEVQESCENPLLVEFSGLEKKQDRFITDGSEKNVQLRISANEYTTIGLLAIDEAVFNLRKYHRLTQKKVFKRMAGYDLGCGPGGGQTSAAILKDAGVTVMTNADLNVVQREVLGCPGPASRRRRSITVADRLEILNQYQGVQREYCKKGLRQLKDPDSMSCKKRAEHLAKKKGLKQDSAQYAAFFNCCVQMKDKSRGRSGDLGDSDMDIDIDLGSVLVRSNFPESWMFDEVETGDNDFVRHQVTLPDSVTTWVIEAVGVSEDYDMCVADPAKLEVRPPFFLDIHMPYAVQRHEQIEILVSVFNYAEDTLRVTVYLKGVEGLCSEAQPGNYSDGIVIDVLSQKPGSVKFVVVPLEAKKLPVEVVAVTGSGSGEYRDAVQKFLNVRPEGYMQRDTVSVVMDPENIRGFDPVSRAGGQNQSYHHTQNWYSQSVTKQVDTIRYEVHSDAIPGTHQFHISLMGSMMGSVVETVIEGLDNLLRIPRGCGEQTMLYLAPNVYVYKYLKHTDQFSTTLETSSRTYIGNGIANELSHRRLDGSFSVWGDNPAYPSSTWLTAFVSKVMCQAREFAFVDDSITCRAMEWLISQTQQDDGSFDETYRVHHQEMTGGVQGKASMTAYVLIALLECECETVDKKESVDSAKEFLEGQLATLTRPYAIAITAYALSLAKSVNASDAIRMLKKNETYNEASNYRYWGSDDSSFGAGAKPYWYSNRPKAIEVETTSYAVLALLEMGEIQYTHAVVNWLTNQENYEGGFVSTQDTVIALQALSEYAIRAQQNDVNINCHVTCQESDFEKDFLLQRDNAIVRQHATLNIPETVSQFHVIFDSAGDGLGQFKFESNYHIPEPDSRKCHFDLIIDGIEGKSGGGAQASGEGNLPEGWDDRSRVGRVLRSAFNRGRIGDGEESSAVSTTIEAPRHGRAGGSGSEYIFNYKVKVRYLRAVPTNMAIVDVGLYTGYQPIESDLEKVKQNSDGVIQRYEVSDRSVVFYLTKITRQYTEINFGAQRIHHVGKAQPVAVHVYDYYKPSVKCVKFVHPQEGSSMLSKLCEGNTCTCAAGKCASPPTTSLDDFNVSKMKKRACASASHFAYEVNVVSIKQKGSFQYFTMTILATLKHGLDPVSKGANRTFWKSKNCGTPDIKKKNYLVIGSGGIPIRDSTGSPSFKYVIDEKMKFYELPNAARRGKRKWKEIDNNLIKLRNDLGNGDGCST